MEFEFALAPYYETSRPKEKLNTDNHSLCHYNKTEEEKEVKEEKGPGSDSGREQEETCDVARKWMWEDDYNDVDETSRDDGKGKEVYVESNCYAVRVRDFGDGTIMSRYECCEEVHRKEFHEDSEGTEEEAENIIPESIMKTSGLALLDMDWTQVKAADLYEILSPFLPQDGKILRVVIYPSEYGVQVMKEEEDRRSVQLIDDDNDNSDHTHEDKLHAEEKRRFRYRYAAAECDCMKTADYIYSTCDVTGLERSSMRYIPHCMEYNYPALDVATGNENELDRSRTFNEVAAEILARSLRLKRVRSGLRGEAKEEENNTKIQIQKQMQAGQSLSYYRLMTSGMENGYKGNNLNNY